MKKTFLKQPRTNRSQQIKKELLGWIFDNLPVQTDIRKVSKVFVHSTCFNVGTAPVEKKADVDDKRRTIDP